MRRLLSLFLSVSIILGFSISNILADTALTIAATDTNTPSVNDTNASMNDVYLPEKYFKIDDMVVPIDDVNVERQEGTVVAYTPSYGKYTKTNKWGLEITVVDNVITKLTKPDYITPNNSYIPENGLVISIHYSNPVFNKLLESINEGDKIEVVLDNFDTTTVWKTKYYALNPSIRGYDQLVVYDRSYGSRTETNGYGYEVIVGEDGKIISAGGNDSEIPYGGYVISGHGKGAEWLKKYALLGSTVMIDKTNKEIIIKHSNASYIDEVEYKLSMLENNLANAKKEFKNISYDDIQSIIDNGKIKLDNAKNYLNKGSYKDAEDMLKSLEDDINKAAYMFFPSEKVESRAIWIRPKEKNLDEVVRNLDMLKSININTIYLDTFWSGYTIYPTSSKYTGQNPIYGGFDVLDAYIKEAHKRGMAVYAWTENFLIGTSDIFNGGPIKKEKPEWLMVSRKGYNYTLDKYGIKYYYLNPAIPEARDFLSELYKEIASKYDIDGIQFDYIRFPNSNDYSNDFGYDDYTRNLFKQYAGVDPKYLNVNSDMWQLWNYFRMNIVNTFVYSVISELRMIKPEIKIAADVWPNYDTAPSDIFQDSKDWVVKNYINTLNPMSYYTTVTPVAMDLRNTMNFANGHSNIVLAIGTNVGTDKVTLLNQIESLRNNGASGIGLFEYESLLKNGYDTALKSSIFSIPAVIPDKDPAESVKAILSEITSNIDGVYVKLGGMTKGQADLYKNMMNSIADSAISPMTIDNAKGIMSDIESTINKIYLEKGISINIISQMANELNRCKSILNSFIADQSFKANHVIDDIKVEIPSMDLKIGNIVPIKVEASYSDNKLDCIYLDPSQYDISSDNTAVVGVSSGALRINGNGKANISVKIKDNLNIKPGTNTKFDFVIDTSSLNQSTISLNGRLRAVNLDGNGVLLDWSGSTVNPNIAGYIVERNGEEIARVNNTSYKDMTCAPGESYTYKIEAFDTSGGILDTSNMISVTTKSNDSKNNYIYLSGTASAYGNIALYRVDEAKSLDVIKNAESDVVINFNSNENTRLKEIIIPVSVINELKMAQRNLVINTDDLKITILKDLLNIDNVNGYISIKITNKGTSQKINNLTPISNIYDIEVTKNGQKVSIPMSVALVTNGTT